MSLSFGCIFTGISFINMYILWDLPRLILLVTNIFPMTNLKYPWKFLSTGYILQ